MGAVTHGADTRRLRAIAEDLQALGGRVGQLEAEGTAQLGVLVEAWSGDDCTTFEGDWQEGSTRLAQVEQRLRAYAKVLAEQAEEQEIASGNAAGGGSTGPAPRTGEKPGPKGLPKQLRGLGDLFSTPDRPDLAANWTSPHWRWAVRKGVDEATDWANDLYTDHVRGTPLAPGLPFVEKGLKESSDWVRDLREQRKETNPSPVDAPGIFLDIVADELDTYGKILEDPKGWWDNDASTWDKIGLGVSLIPVVGVPAKIATKTTKEVADVARHGDDVKMPHIPKATPGGSIEDLEDAAKHPDPNDGYSGHKSAVSQKALDILEKNDVTDLDKVWDDVTPMPRGYVLEATEGGNLPQSFPVIDRVDTTADGLDVTSIKSLDPEGVSYTKGNKFENTVNEYVDKIAEFDGESHGGVDIDGDDVGGRTLDLIVRPDSMTEKQNDALDRAIQRAETKGVKLVVKERP